MSFGTQKMFFRIRPKKIETFEKFQFYVEIFIFSRDFRFSPSQQRANKALPEAPVPDACLGSETEK